MTEPPPESGTDVPVDQETAQQAKGAAGQALEGVREAHAEHEGRAAGAGGAERTVVHLMRHGEVDNPHKILYGRLPGYHLSDLGRKMADAVAEHLTDADLALVVHSPLERAAETAEPVTARHDLIPVVDPRVIEAGNRFEGRRFRKRLLLDPRRWWWLRDPTQPTWGESYRAIGKRMMAAVEDARDHARGHEALVVSHQLPIWTMRSALDGRRLWHDPRRRECNLASLTSVIFSGDRVVDVSYSEPAAHLHGHVQGHSSFVPGA